MRFGSVCSGIEAASVAWEPLGWTAAWLSEIEPFPSAVLAYHWPDVPNLGNMTLLPERIAAGEVDAPDVLVGGTPCQAFSVAGLRNSLEDARGNLTLTYVELADAIDSKRSERGEKPCIIVWENVPGVLSTKDNAFGCFLAGLAGEDEPLLPPRKRWTNAGVVLGPKRAIAWRILDAQYLGLAQRRRRVFVVASARDGFDPSQVLLEFDGVRRDTAPRREAGESFAHDAGTGAARGSHWDALTNPHPSLNQSHNTGGIGASNQELFSQRGAGITWPADVASTLDAAFGSKQGLEDQHVNGGCPLFVPAQTVALRGRDGGATAELGGEVAVPVMRQDLAQCLTTGTGKRYGPETETLPVVFGWQNSASQGDSVSEHVTPTLDKSKTPAVAFDPNQVTSKANRSQPTLERMHTMPAASAAPCLFTPAVRRLTPRECERLQGFPDDYTLTPHRGKPAADGPRYKALGNSMAVPCMAWIGRRIQRHLGGRL